MGQNFEDFLHETIKAENQNYNNRFKITKPSEEDDSPHVQVIRNTFTFPKEYCDLITMLKRRCLSQGVAANHSEIMRIGLKLLCTLSDQDLAMEIERLPKVKTGRPKVKKKIANI